MQLFRGERDPSCKGVLQRAAEEISVLQRRLGLKTS